MRPRLEEGNVVPKIQLDYWSQFFSTQSWQVTKWCYTGVNTHQVHSCNQLHVSFDLLIFLSPTLYAPVVPTSFCVLLSVCLCTVGSALIPCSVGKWLLELLHSMKPVRVRSHFTPTRWTERIQRPTETATLSRVIANNIIDTRWRTLRDSNKLTVVTGWMMAGYCLLTRTVSIDGIICAD